MLKALVDGRYLLVTIISNYSDDKKEVIIKEGVNKGKYTIVRSENLKVETYKQLLELINSDIKGIDISNNHITELINESTYNTIKQFANKYNITDSEYYKLISSYDYENCKTKEDLKIALLLESLNNNISGIKSSFTSVKRNSLINI